MHYVYVLVATAKAISNFPNLTGSPFSPTGPAGPTLPGRPGWPIAPAGPAGPLSPVAPWKYKMRGEASISHESYFYLMWWSRSPVAMETTHFTSPSTLCDMSIKQDMVQETVLLNQAYSRSCNTRLTFSSL